MPVLRYFVRMPVRRRPLYPIRARDGEWSVDSPADIALRRCRLLIAATIYCEWAVCHRTVDQRHHAGNFERTAAAGAKQSGNLYANGDALVNCGYSNPSKCYVRRK